MLSQDNKTLSVLISNSTDLQCKVIMQRCSQRCPLDTIVGPHMEVLIIGKVRSYKI